MNKGRNDRARSTTRLAPPTFDGNRRKHTAVLVTDPSPPVVEPGPHYVPAATTEQRWQPSLCKIFPILLDFLRVFSNLVLGSIFGLDSLDCTPPAIQATPGSSVFTCGHPFQAKGGWKRPYSSGANNKFNKLLPVSNRAHQPRTRFRLSDSPVRPTCATRAKKLRPIVSRSASRKAFPNCKASGCRARAICSSTVSISWTLNSSRVGRGPRPSA